MDLSRAFKTRYFHRWQRKVELSDSTLLSAVREMRNGLIDAQLGSGVVKKRIALPGRGKRGGARTLIATNRGDRWFFLVGYEKSEMENIDLQDLRSIQGYARDLLELTWAGIEHRLELGSLLELHHEA